MLWSPAICQLCLLFSAVHSVEWFYQSVSQKTDACCSWKLRLIGDKFVETKQNKPQDENNPNRVTKIVDYCSVKFNIFQYISLVMSFGLLEQLLFWKWFSIVL